jgi:hypothetical protein
MTDELNRIILAGCLLICILTDRFDWASFFAIMLFIVIFN